MAYFRAQTAIGCYLKANWIQFFATGKGEIRSPAAGIKPIAPKMLYFLIAVSYQKVIVRSCFLRRFWLLTSVNP